MTHAKRTIILFISFVDNRYLCFAISLRETWLLEFIVRDADIAILRNQISKNILKKSTDIAGFQKPVLNKIKMLRYHTRMCCIVLSKYSRCMYSLISLMDHDSE